MAEEYCFRVSEIGPACELGGTSWAGLRLLVQVLVWV